MIQARAPRRQGCVLRSAFVVGRLCRANIVKLNPMAEPAPTVRAALLRGWQHGGSVRAASHSAVATANASVGGRQFAAPLSSRGTIVRATRRRRLERCAVRKGSSAPRRSVPTGFQFGVSSLLKLNNIIISILIEPL